MQTLNVKSSDGSTKTVTVHRSWQDITGRHVFLHANGVYGYKDGTPVRTVSELDVLPPEHKRLALAWWERAGKAMADVHYGRKEEEAARKAGDFQEELAAREYNTQLDSILYSRRAIVKGKPKGAVTAPKSWMEFGFTRRPDWWGQAQAIAFSDYAYTILNPESETQNPEQTGALGRTVLGSEAQAPATPAAGQVAAPPDPGSSPDSPEPGAEGDGNPADPGNPEEF